MKPETVLLLNAGGLRGLIAAALLKHNEPDTRQWMLFVDDGRPTADKAFAMSQEQAKALDAFRLDRVPLALQTHALLPPGQTDTDTGWAPSPLRRVSVLLAGLIFAQHRGIRRIIAPLACDQDFNASATATQQITLCHELLAAEPVPRHKTAAPATPTIQAPLLDFTDAQLLDLIAQTGSTPYQLAWSCQIKGPAPCNQCPACRRRQAAFHHAGQQDPTAPRLAAHV